MEEQTDESPDSSDSPVTPETPDTVNLQGVDGGLQFVTRMAWLSSGVTEDRPLQTSASIILYSHSKTYSDKLNRNVPHFNYNDTRSNIEKVRAMQEFDTRITGDIRFSFLIGADGMVYEGRGWQTSPSCPKKYSMFENQCLFITMLEPLPDNAGVQGMLRTRETLIKYGVANGYIKPSFIEVTMDNKYFWPKFRKFLSRI